MTTRELASRTGITKRQIQWWTEHGILQAAFDERCARVFDDDQALVALIVREIRRKGLGLAQIRRWKLTPPRADYLVIVAGRAVWADQMGVIAVAKQAASGCYVVSIEELQAELEGGKRAGARSSAARPALKAHAAAL